MEKKTELIATRYVQNRPSLSGTMASAPVAIMQSECLFIDMTLTNYTFMTFLKEEHRVNMDKKRFVNWKKKQTTKSVHVDRLLGIFVPKIDDRFS